MLEVVLKHRLAGSFSSGIEVAQSQVNRTHALNMTSTPANEGGGRFTADKDAKEIVMKKLNSERGMSLVEATIILAILATLTAVLSPSMGDFIEDSRQMKAKEDVEVLGISIKRLLRDTGSKAVKLDGAVAVTLVNRVEVLTTNEGTAAALGAAATAFTSTANFLAANTVNWTGANEDTFEDQLLRNFDTTAAAAIYSLPAASNRARGWRGSYINSNQGADPWGYKYYAGVAFLSVATNAAAGTTEGQLSGYWNRDVVVLSGGANNTIDTPIGANAGAGTVTGTDDIAFVLQGNTF